MRSSALHVASLWTEPPGNRKTKLCIYFQRLRDLGVSLVAQMVKNLPAVQETWVRSLGWEEPLEKGMANGSHVEQCSLKAF